MAWFFDYKQILNMKLKLKIKKAAFKLKTASKNI